MNRNWIEREFLCDWGLRSPYEHDLELHVGSFSPVAYADRSIAREIEDCETQCGSLQQLLSHLSAGQRGTWFFAGWIDQAVLHVGEVLPGDERLLATMLRQIDEDQVDQSGDMMVGFVPREYKWLFVVEVSPDHKRFVVTLKTNCPDQMQAARERLGL